MSREIEGIVKKAPVMLEECCIFPVEQEGGTYLVVSSNRQAVKDHIFLQKGQRVQIRGDDMEQSDFRGIIMAKEEKIKLNARPFVEGTNDS